MKKTEEVEDIKGMEEVKGWGRKWKSGGVQGTAELRE